MFLDVLRENNEFLIVEDEEKKITSRLKMEHV